MNNLISIPEVLERAYKMNPEKEVLYDGFTRVTYKKLYDEDKTVIDRIGLQGDAMTFCEKKTCFPAGLINRPGSKRRRGLQVNNR